MLYGWLGLRHGNFLLRVGVLTARTVPSDPVTRIDAHMSTSWMSPKLAPADVSVAGRGSYARVEIAPGEVVVAFGGKVVAGDVFAAPAGPPPVVVDSGRRRPVPRRARTGRAARHGEPLVRPELRDPGQHPPRRHPSHRGRRRGLLRLRHVGRQSVRRVRLLMRRRIVSGPHHRERLVAARADRTVSGLVLRVSPGRASTVTSASTRPRSARRC